MNSDPIALTMGQNFELERLNRAIDSTDSVEDLRQISKMLASAWMTQKAAVNWVIRNHMTPVSGDMIKEILETKDEK